MRSRGLVVAIAVVLAVLAAAGIIVYTSNLEESVRTENTVAVIVASETVPPNTALDPLLARGVFTQIQVPIEAQVASAVTTLDQLAGQTSAAEILQNEQIPLERLASTAGNVFGITEGNVGLGISIGGPESVNGAIGQGAHIVMYATFPQGTAVSKDTLDKLLTPAQIQKFYEAVQGGTTSGLAQANTLVLPVDFTVTLMPSVQVLAIQNPPIDPTTNRKGEGNTTMVLDLAPEDASLLVYSTSKAQLYVGLLPPENEEGYETGATVGVPLAKVTGVGR
jgi:hypothetical protein